VTETLQPLSVNDLVERLDAAHGKTWNVWRDAMGGWCVQIVLPGDKREVVSGDTFEDAMLAACEWRDVPRIRRRPQSPGELTPKRDGSKWNLIDSSGRFFCGNIKTKREAEHFASGFASRFSREIEAWEAAYGSIATGVEGKDFRYV
jgi:hypothetical protein